MRRVKFSESVKRALHYERFHHPHPRVRLKMEVVWLKSQGLTHQEIGHLAQVDLKTVENYLDEYEEGGIERLKEVRFCGSVSELAAHQETIEVYFRAHSPATINEAVAAIEKLTGIKCSPTQVRLFLKSLGMKRLKTGALPAKADPDKQEAFKKNAGATPSRSQSRQARRVFRGGGPLCFWRFFVFPLVFYPRLN